MKQTRNDHFSTYLYADFFLQSISLNLSTKKNVLLLSSALLKGAIYLGLLGRAFQKLLAQGFDAKDEISLWADVLGRLVLMYMMERNLAKTESLSKKAFTHCKRDDEEHNIESAHFLERFAHTQAYQGNNEEADNNYTSLLTQISFQQGTILVNIGSIKRRQFQFGEVKRFYQLCSSFSSQL